MYVADFLTDRITKLRTDGTVIIRWGRSGNGDGAFDAPGGIAVDDAGNVYVADFYNHRVQKFTSDGDYMAQWGGIGFGVPGKWPGWFALSKALTVDGQGDVYVADAFNSRIQKFTGGGVLLGQLGTRGSGDGQFRYPAGVAADPAFSSAAMGSSAWITDSPSGPRLTRSSSAPNAFL